MLKDTPTRIRLTGGGGGKLTHTVISPPPQGSLSGEAPDLTYTPPSGFSGITHFTFSGSNGGGKSVPARVSISVQSGTFTPFTWVKAVSGNWSDGTKWTPGLPASTGHPFFSLNFTTGGTYTATHDLDNGFQLNQLPTTAAKLTLDGSSSLSFAANGGSLPRFNQNGPDPVVVSNPVSLPAMATMGGSGTGSIRLAGMISGSGGIIKSSPGVVRIGLEPAADPKKTLIAVGESNLYGTDKGMFVPGANSYTGKTSIKKGMRLRCATAVSLGSGPLEINGDAKLDLAFTGTNLPPRHLWLNRNPRPTSRVLFTSTAPAR